MRDIPFVDCIVNRVLVLHRADGTTANITLEIGRPVPVPQYDIPFACPFRLVGLDKEERLYSVGEDSAQALQLALQMMGAWLDITAKGYGGEFSAFGGKGHGFSVS
jgi:hypothetical protein